MVGWSNSSNSLNLLLLLLSLLMAVLLVLLLNFYNTIGIHCHHFECHDFCYATLNSNNNNNNKFTYGISVLYNCLLSNVMVAVLANGLFEWLMTINTTQPLKNNFVDRLKYIRSFFFFFLFFSRTQSMF